MKGRFVCVPFFLLCRFGLEIQKSKHKKPYCHFCIYPCGLIQIWQFFCCPKYKYKRSKYNYPSFSYNYMELFRSSLHVGAIISKNCVPLIKKPLHDQESLKKILHRSIIILIGKKQAICHPRRQYHGYYQHPEEIHRHTFCAHHFVCAVVL